MIKINLATRKTANVVTGTQTSLQRGLKFDLKDIRFSQLGEIPNLGSFIFLAVLGVGGYYGLNYYKSGEIEKLDTVLNARHAELEKVKTSLKKTGELEAQKKALEADQHMLQEKYDVITKLGDGRQVPSQLLAKLAELTPRDLWLTSVQMDPQTNPNKPGLMTLRGEARRIEDITQFSSSLQENVFFSSARPNQTEKAHDSASGLDIYRFDMPVERR